MAWAPMYRGEDKLLGMGYAFAAFKSTSVSLPSLDAVIHVFMPRNHVPTPHSSANREPVSRTRI
jgi:hypothetical protein